MKLGGLPTVSQETILIHAKKCMNSDAAKAEFIKEMSLKLKKENPHLLDFIVGISKMQPRGGQQEMLIFVVMQIYALLENQLTTDLTTG